MKDAKALRINLFIPMLVVIMSAVNFNRIEGAENVKTIQIVTLIVLGAGLGVFLVNLFTILKYKK
jgi:hypothetical protein